MFKAKVLVVDDEQQVRELLTRRLNRFSYDVVSTDSGENALEVLKYNPVGVVVTDLNMPGINGLELITKAVEMNPAIQGIIISGYLDEQVEKQAKSFRNVVIFEKPLNFTTLNNSIVEALTRQDELQKPEIPS